ncbi:MAG TPA: Tn3 family transposase [Trebonia sp.]
MRQTISLGVDDLAATWFAVSPLAATTFALQLPRTGDAGPADQPWLRWARYELSRYLSPFRRCGRCCVTAGAAVGRRRHEEVEMTALCLRILQAALVYVNTLILQDVLAEGEWAAMLGPAGRRGLTPLFWQHVRPYGEVRPDMGARLRIGGAG